MTEPLACFASLPVSIVSLFAPYGTSTFAIFTEFADGLFILLGIDLFEVGQKASPLPDHEQKPAAGMMILLVDLEMIVEIIDPLRKKRNLDRGRTRVLGMCLEVTDHLCFLLFD
jgi:hypothetical protein